MTPTKNDSEDRKKEEKKKLNSGFVFYPYFRWY